MASQFHNLAVKLADLLLDGIARFEQRSGQRPYRLLEHPRYRAGWDFLELRCKSGELEGEPTADDIAWSAIKDFSVAAVFEEPDALERLILPVFSPA